MLWAPSLLSNYIPIIKCSCILDNFCVIRTSIWFITVLFKCLTTAENLKGTKIWINYLCCMISKLPLSTHTFVCLYAWHASTAHTHTATSTHSEIMSSSAPVNVRKQPQSLEPQETAAAAGWWSHQLQSQAHVPEKRMWTWNVSEHRHGFWGAHSYENCWGFLGGCGRGGRAEVRGGF